MNYTRYQRNPVVDFPQRKWPNREIEKAPIWCSVDLRDGNQALEIPMKVDLNNIMYDIEGRNLWRFLFRPLSVFC